MHNYLTVIGGGLAGSEAAWQAARRGVQVKLYEMRPVTQTPAHKTDRLAELVCSNSLRSDSTHNAVGLLKEELRRAGSLIIQAADETRVPAGGALAVDRLMFADFITRCLEAEPLVEVIRQEVSDLPDNGITVLASGPLTSQSMASCIQKLTGSDQLYFYDAIAPILDAESINWSRVYKASRYGRGDDYVNCPMQPEEYDRFYDALITAEKATTHLFEEEKVFEGCMPIEVLAARGKKTLCFGPMKPVGLPDPKTGKEPHAVIQLRTENQHKTAYNMVGFQTKLKQPEQIKVFQMIPGLEQAEFLRFGSLHRNTYLCSPRLLDNTLRFRTKPNIMLAGQISGVEGYVESTAMGWLAGVNAARLLKGNKPVIPPEETAHGGLVGHITASRPERFQPSNINFGLLPALGKKIRNKKERYECIAVRALKAWEAFLAAL